LTFCTGECNSIITYRCIQQTADSMGTHRDTHRDTHRKAHRDTHRSTGTRTEAQGGTYPSILQQSDPPSDAVVHERETGGDLHLSLRVVCVVCVCASVCLLMRVRVSVAVCACVRILTSVQSGRKGGRAEEGSKASCTQELTRNRQGEARQDRAAQE
jgi:hypothetical protein